jgi:hypothetical protein
MGPRAANLAADVQLYRCRRSRRVAPVSLLDATYLVQNGQHVLRLVVASAIKAASVHRREASGVAKPQEILARPGG